MESIVDVMLDVLSACCFPNSAAHPAHIAYKFAHRVIAPIVAELDFDVQWVEAISPDICTGNANVLWS